jgi:hypothetical protein
VAPHAAPSADKSHNNKPTTHANPKAHKKPSASSHHAASLRKSTGVANVEVDVQVDVKIT